MNCRIMGRISLCIPSRMLQPQPRRYKKGTRADPSLSLSWGCATGLHKLWSFTGHTGRKGRAGEWPCCRLTEAEAGPWWDMVRGPPGVGRASRHVSALGSWNLPCNIFNKISPQVRHGFLSLSVFCKGERLTNWRDFGSENSDYEVAKLCSFALAPMTLLNDFSRQQTENVQLGSMH